ncbi:Hsp20/alpha crystallin family protein [Flavobacteriaceae bacterium S0825]|uniref:Hsp20/alpha crystallin family protein n=1 Tax=Gaetbulibacter sp. S0825 TaxID=2720084 RepID=UPI0014310B12|nr:Hsp20/alpha crystallin family protein [Gaetbulibacter sp. S0825]MCK0109432.1 Hsp20/alpha crystallin family protein [Flavobacteriaceae bacterium S0825]NIX65067.1 Hsp20/alpha crystallin family protein [Gaetbulibacter sp. S0825]
MTLIKFKNRNRLFPTWNNDNLNTFLSYDDFLNDDFFEEDSLMPAMNVKEHDKDFEIEFAAPGFSKKDFEVTIDDNILHVCGEKRKEEEEKEEGYTRKEFSYNSFKRSLKLPNTVNAEQDVKAVYNNGILKLNLLKKEEAKEQPKKVIEVL